MRSRRLTRHRAPVCLSRRPTAVLQAPSTRPLPIGRVIAVRPEVARQLRRAAGLPGQLDQQGGGPGSQQGSSASLVPRLRRRALAVQGDGRRVQVF